ncbi:hypothetical protein C5C27_16470 [Rathayibacter sp. AY2B7]|uniref:hypothetical protein n=1 Tax=unclassified Rathayibacter TaxID=2609250 RepID=UPI000CE88CBE|nr:MULTISPECIES: hypothetical protein [unclassified Rathayibacter]PPG01018.1 hypothetical protein C5C26_16615 [Rathayibacter sp. AY2B1]PPG51680.1 hypothetical protein C5C27_16470 [Rathayibacter sp. AY2B7]PPG73587.1 hypothetical protein C5C59_02920 [Rathayibacter sp. AY1F4]
MIECALCGTDAVVLDRSGGRDAEEELVVLCADCTPGEITEALEAALLDPALLEPAGRSAHARAA